MSTTYLQPQFGSYRYSSIAGTFDLFSRFTDGVGAKLRIADPPLVDGGFTAGGLIAPRKLSIRGTMTIAAAGSVQTDAATFRGVRDNFNLVHIPGTAALFSLDDDRCIWAEVESASFPEWSKGLTFIEYQVDFHCADPFWYGAIAYTPHSTTTALNVGGASVPTRNASQLTNPVTAPTLAAAAASTALLAGVYTVAYTWRDAYGETQCSSTHTVTLTAGQKINVSALALPSGASSANLYCSIAAGSATLAWARTWDGTAVSITALPASPNSTTVTPAGSVYSLPILNVTVSAAPANGLVYISCAGAGKTWALQFSPLVTGTYIIDCTRQIERVTLGGVDVTSSVFCQGVFPRLAAAANTVIVGVSGGATVSGATCVSQDRWL